MFRILRNRIKGRKKILSESISYTRLQQMLSRLDYRTWIKGTHNYGFTNRVVYSPESLIREMKKFESGSLSKCEFIARHQVFEGKNGEKHYIDINQREKYNYHVGERMYNPILRLNLEFVLETI